MLSPRQREVLQHIANGLRIKQAADRMGLAHCTANDYAGHAARELGAKSQAHAVAIAVRKGLIE